MTRPLQLGAHHDGTGTTFTVLSRHADAVELCFFARPEAAWASRRVRLRRSRRRGEDSVWWARVDDAPPGTLYGYRVYGPFRPQDGHVFNPSKLLLDPWARAVTGRPRIPAGLSAAESGLWGLQGSGARPGQVYDGTDSAVSMPKCVVTSSEPFDWQGVEKPRTPWRDTVIYEAHVKGLTKLHPDVPPELRGTYLGLAQEPVLDHLRRLGITAVELMPVFQSAPEDHLLRSGRTNYWGYSAVGFFAPEAEYAVDPRGGQVREFQTLVRELHRAGIEVILDVVYNHTAEGGRRGPTFCLKGFDQALFYRLRRENPRRHEDFTGCGNTLDLTEPRVRELVLDSLRYWVEEMGVDGFRFDLAPALVRDAAGGFGDGFGDGFFDGADDGDAFFEELATDPVFDGVKWIAEPWDVPPAGKPSGYRLGRFPRGWAEWNDRFRDGARRVWRGDASGAATAELAARLAGSPDIFGERAPFASVNYVAAHDGFTLADLTSYEHKHNLANGENNRDGSDHNLSRAWGPEGPTDDPEVRARRALHRRNLLATLFLARGVPMLGHGDEMGRSQGGNNNAYCHDDRTTWMHWESPGDGARPGPDGAQAEIDEELLAFTRRLAALRRRLPRLRDAATGIRWMDASGEEIEPEAWARGEVVSFAADVSGALSGPRLLVNGAGEAVTFRLPGGPFRLLLDSARPEETPEDQTREDQTPEDQTPEDQTPEDQTPEDEKEDEPSRHSTYVVEPLSLVLLGTLGAEPVWEEPPWEEPPWEDPLP